MVDGDCSPGEAIEEKIALVGPFWPVGNPSIRIQPRKHSLAVVSMAGRGVQPVSN